MDTLFWLILGVRSLRFLHIVNIAHHHHKGVTVLYMDAKDIQKSLCYIRNNSPLEARVSATIGPCASSEG